MSRRDVTKAAAHTVPTVLTDQRIMFDPNAILFSPKLIHMFRTRPDNRPNNDSTQKVTINGCEAAL